MIEMEERKAKLTPGELKARRKELLDTRAAHVANYQTLRYD